MENDPLAQDKKRVAKLALVEQFEASEQGQLIISWLNGEIVRLTEKLADDDELDTDNVKRAAVRAELKAYRFIGQKLGATKIMGRQSRETLRTNDEEPGHIEVNDLIDKHGL